MRDPEDGKYWPVSFPGATRDGYLRAMRWAAEYIRGIDPRAFDEGLAKLAAFGGSGGSRPACRAAANSAGSSSQTNIPEILAVPCACAAIDRTRVGARRCASTDRQGSRPRALGERWRSCGPVGCGRFAT